MKFAVGYQLAEAEEEPFLDIVRDFRGEIEEVYFPWLDMPTCRAALSARRGDVDWAAQERLESDLCRLKEWGIKLDLLFNANCYGRYAVSEYLANRVTSIVAHVIERVGSLETVTSTSPAIAQTIKERFPEIELRASVNMRIGTVKGMEYVADLFDSFHMQREYNRDFQRIDEVKAWADAHGKRLILLGNSGCMNFCSGQIFHDNLVAHEAEIDEMRNIPGWTPHLCWRYYQDREHWVSVLQNSWIRPEDLHHYEDRFEVVKLATRMHARPRMVIQAYVARRFAGNLLDLFEPGLGPVFAPFVVDNSRFPDDWFERTSRCSKICHECDYCRSVLGRVAVRADGA